MELANDQTQSGWQRAAALLLSALFALTLPVALAFHAVGSQLFVTDKVQEAVAENVVQSAGFRRLIVKSMLSDPGGQQVEQFVSTLSNEEMDELAQVLLPEQWLEQQVAMLVEASYEWLDGEELLPQLVFDLEPLKVHMQGEPAEQAALLVMRTWPACTRAQLESLASAALEGDAAISLARCLPPEPFQTVMQGALGEALRAEMAQLPATETLGGGVADRQGLREFAEIKSALRTLRWLVQWGWMVPATLLGPIMAVAVRSIRTWALWWGVPLFSGGVLTLLLVVGLGGALEQQIITLAGTLDVSQAFDQALARTLRHLYQEGLGLLALEALLASGIGVVLLAAARLTAPSPR